MAALIRANFEFSKGRHDDTVDAASLAFNRLTAEVKLRARIGRRTVGGATRSSRPAAEESTLHDR